MKWQHLLFGLMLVVPVEARAQDPDWGWLVGAAGYKRSAVAMQADAAYWLNDWVRIGPVGRGLVFSPFDGDCPAFTDPEPGTTCSNPISILGSLGIRLSREHRRESGAGLFVEASALSMRFQRGSDFRWGLGGGMRYRGRVSLEIGGLVVPETVQEADVLIYLGIGRNRQSD